MSGGVDSSVTAYLLKEQGYAPIGLFMRNGVEGSAPVQEGPQAKSCCSIYDAKDARVVAGELGIPFHAIDLAPEFQQLIGYFTSEYASGRTPNPCAVCNRELKFGRLHEIARELGAEFLATGHYAQVEERDGELYLRRAVDRKKDQSYQLFDVRREVLARTMFPLGGMHKEEVRAIARKLGMATADKAESQEICFVPSNDYRDLLRERGVTSRAGEIVDREGKRLGQHEGVAHFTIGQRRGLGVATGEPAYVSAIDAQTGRVMLGSKEDCLFRGLRASRLNWLVPPPPPGETIRADAQIRYRHPGRPGRVGIAADGRAEFIFDEPELAVTPGQAAVFYDGDRVLGGGWIESALR